MKKKDLYDKDKRYDSYKKIKKSLIPSVIWKDIPENKNPYGKYKERNLEYHNKKWYN